MFVPRLAAAPPIRARARTAAAVLLAAATAAGAPIAIRHIGDSTSGQGVISPPSARDGVEIAVAARPRAAAPPLALPPAHGAERGGAGMPFTIELPDGWRGGEVDDIDDDAARSFRYADSHGRSFVVNLDPAGSDFDADEVWRYRVRGDRFEVASQARCVPGEPMCSLGDGTLTVFAVWEQGGSATVGGHAWYFRFGDAAGELAGTRVFRQILEGIRVTR